MNTRIQQYADVPVELRVIIDQMPVRIADLLTLRPGQTLTTRRPLREQLELRAENVVLATVEVTTTAGALAAAIASLHVGPETGAK